MSDSSEVDKAIIRTLLADSQLMTLFPGGIFFDEAKPGTSKFVKVSLVEHLDVPEFAKVGDPTTGRAYETALYLVLVVALATTGADVDAGAARIDAVLENQEPVGGIVGYNWMATYRERRIRTTEVDGKDASIRWQSRGGHYRIEVSPAA